MHPECPTPSGELSPWGLPGQRAQLQHPDVALILWQKLVCAEFLWDLVVTWVFRACSQRVRVGASLHPFHGTSWASSPDLSGSHQGLDISSFLVGFRVVSHRSVLRCSRGAPSPTPLLKAGCPGRTCCRGPEWARGRQGRLVGGRDRCHPTGCAVPGAVQVEGAGAASRAECGCRLWLVVPWG